MGQCTDYGAYDEGKREVGKVFKVEMLVSVPTMVLTMKVSVR